jgi:hypothetical protein
MEGAEVVEVSVSGREAGNQPVPVWPRAPVQTNIGAGLDRLLELLPPGAAREFVRGLPRRAGREEVLANLEALVRVLQIWEHPS